MILLDVQWVYQYQIYHENGSPINIASEVEHGTLGLDVICIHATQYIFAIQCKLHPFGQKCNKYV